MFLMHTPFRRVRSARLADECSALPCAACYSTCVRPKPGWPFGQVVMRCVRCLASNRRIPTHTRTHISLSTRLGNSRLRSWSTELASACIGRIVWCGGPADSLTVWAAVVNKEARRQKTNNKQPASSNHRMRTRLAEPVTICGFGLEVMTSGKDGTNGSY